MKRLRLKVNIKKMVFDFFSILLIFCIIASVIIGVIEFVPAFFKEDNIEKKALPVVVDTSKDAKKGSIEVLSTGNSCLYSSLNPLQLYNDYGMTSYVAASPKQNMSVSYYMVKEILTVQSPKVLILETNAFFDSRGYDDEKKNLDIVYKNAFSIFKYSSRWNEMVKNKYVVSKSKNEKILTHGFYYVDTVVPYNYGMSYMKQSDKRENLSATCEKYLPKIMALAQEKGIKVLFVSFPSQTAWSYEKHNKTSDVAAQYGVEFIDYNVNDYGSGFDWKTDSRDGGNHLNYAGSKKVTKSIGDYLVAHFDLNNFKGKANFTDWDADYKEFMKMVSK